MTNAVACLDPETIAAYLDRRLDPAERARVEEHLADCEECRTLLSETALFLEADAAATPAVVVPLVRPVGPTRRPWLWSMAAAAAVLLALTPLVLQRMRPTPESALEELDRALAGKRYVESRLSGFEYGAFVAATRGPSVRLEDLPLSAVAAAGKVEELAGTSDTPESLASLGASQLAIGRVDRAVENLEDAARLTPKNARVQSDLAAAYLARFRAGDYPEDPAKAVEAAATAVALDPQSRAAAFNRALALEALPLRGEALRAWEAYLAIDPSSGWANEARAHIEELKRPLPPPPPSPSAMLDELESDVLPTWGRAVLAAQDTAARTALSRARSLAAEIEALDGDQLALATLAAIDAASLARLTSLARAHVLVGEGRHAYLDGRFAEANRAFADAYDLLLVGRSQYANWVLMRQSTSLFQIRGTAGAREALDRLQLDPTSPTPTLYARARRMRALIHVREGDFATSLRNYAMAQSSLSHDTSGDDAIALRFLVGENQELLGDRPAAWKELRAGLAQIQIVRNTRQRQARFFETATYALRQGRPRTGVHLLDALLREPAEHLSSRTLAECLIHRARIIARLGLRPEASRLLVAGAAALAQAERATNLPGLRAEMLSARGEVLATTSPQEAISSLSQVLPLFDEEGARWRLGAVRLQLGRARAAAGDLDGADIDFVAAIGVAEQQLSPLNLDQLRVSFFALTQDAFAARLKIAVLRGVRPEVSFDLSEQAKARALRDQLLSTSRPLSMEAVRKRLPRGMTLVSYAILDDRVLVWRIDARSVESWSEPVSSTQLSTLVDTLSRDLHRGRASGASQELYDLLVRRSVSTPGVESLTVVPDGCLHRVPFAALIDRQTDRHLVEQVAITIAPSATLYASSVVSRTEAPTHTVLIQPARQDQPELKYAAQEAGALANVYRNATILSGRSATKSAVIDAIQRSTVVHFAGHALVNKATPYLSRLLLADSAGDGSLFAHEIQRLRLPLTRLIVLGACSTGRGPAYAGEGTMSLARPFLSAGVPSVVASLWDVDDRAAQWQLIAFHREVANGQSPAQALRTAQVLMLRSEDARFRDPSNWAAFELFATGSSGVAGG